MKLMRTVISMLLFLTASGGLHAQTGNGSPKLKRIYFNLYTDSIKTILNYYVNVEGEYNNGRILPMDAGTITITADHGSMSGVEWIAPKTIDFEKVSFQAVAKDDPGIRADITVWLKRAKDPRDEFRREDMDLPTVPEDIRKRRR